MQEVNYNPTMSTRKVNVPLITVVPETEDTDDQKLLTLEEALTDIEDLDTDNARNKITCKDFKSKLKIRLTDDEATDYEDLEASDDEEDAAGSRSPTLEELEKLNSDFQIAIEMHEKQRGYSKGETTTQKLLKNTTAGMKRLSLSAYAVDAGLTDVEQFNTSDEETDIELPEANFKYELYDRDSREIIHEVLRADTMPVPSPNVTPTKFTKSMQPLTDLSDIEIRDDKASKDCAKKTKKRKRRIQSCNQSFKNVEYCSKENAKTLTSGCKPSRQSNNMSLTVNSEEKECLTDVEEIQLQEETACKMSKPTPRRSLGVERFLEKEPTTDVEEYETDDDDIVMPPAKFCSKSKSSISQTKKTISGKCTNGKCPSVRKPKGISIERMQEQVNKIGNKRESSTKTRQINNRKLFASIAEVVPTDEEYVSDADDVIESSYKRNATPDLPVFEGGTILVNENLSTPKNKFLGVTTKEEPVTDTEELLIGSNEKKVKRKTSSLVVPKKKLEAETETEDLYPSDVEQKGKPKPNRSNNFQPETETDNMFSSDEEYNHFIKTPFQSESDNETVISKPTQQKKNLLLSPHGQSANASPMVTDVDELETSSEEVATVKRATSDRVHKQLKSECISKVHNQQCKTVKPPQKNLFIRGEIYTDMEDITTTDEESVASFKSNKRFSVDLTDDKITVTVTQINVGSCSKWNNCSFSFGIFGKQGKKCKLVSPVF